MERRHGHFDASEDAVQEALLAGAVPWPRDGVPDDPRGWLIRVVSRRLTDHLRSEEARRRREERDAAPAPADAFVAPSPGQPRAPSWDDTLTVLFLCCHPDLSPSAQVALTLRAVGGPTTAETARAHLVPEATMAVGVPPMPVRAMGEDQQGEAADQDLRRALPQTCSRRPAVTCWTWPVTGTAHGPATGRRRAAPSVNRNAATCWYARPAWPDRSLPDPSRPVRARRPRAGGHRARWRPVPVRETMEAYE